MRNMSSKHKRRLLYLLILLLGLSVVVGLVLFALQQNINLFYTPQELLAANPKSNLRVRLGGMVVAGSLRQSANMNIEFKVTDFGKEITVVYQGVVPDLFREGQGVVALGALDAQNIFRAEQILAKHDEKYMPPELAALNK